MNRILLSGAALAALLAAPAFAQGAEPAPESSLAFCARIENDQARLACFDLAARGGDVAEFEAPEPASPPADAGTETADDTGRFGLSRPSTFGLGLPDVSLPRFGRSDGSDLIDAAGSAEPVPEARVVERDDDGDPSKILLVIDRVSTFGYNTSRFHMTNGQVWEATDGMRVRIPRSDPLTGEIRVAGMGGYFLRLNGEGRAIRVRRID